MLYFKSLKIGQWIVLVWVQIYFFINMSSLIRICISCMEPYMQILRQTVFDRSKIDPQTYLIEVQI